MTLLANVKILRFQVQARRFRQAKKQVHVLHGLAGSAFHQIVDNRGDEQLLAEFLHVQQALVGIHYLLEVNFLVRNRGERRVGVETSWYSSRASSWVKSDGV